MLAMPRLNPQSLFCCFSKPLAESWVWSESARTWTDTNMRCRYWAWKLYHICYNADPSNHVLFCFLIYVFLFEKCKEREMYFPSSIPHPKPVIFRGRLGQNKETRTPCRAPICAVVSWVYMSHHLLPEGSHKQEFGSDTEPGSTGYPIWDVSGLTSAE